MNKKGRKEGREEGRREGGGDGQKVKSRGGILVAREVLTVEIYTVSLPEKISICLIRGRTESLGNDDVSVVHARK